MKQNTFNILFYIRRGQLNKQGEGGIMVRLSVNGEREMFSTKLAVNPEIWDSKSGRAIGKTAKIKELNGKLSDIQVLLRRHYYDLEQRHIISECANNYDMRFCARL